MYGLNGNLADKELIPLEEVAPDWGWEPDYTIYVRTPSMETLLETYQAGPLV